jgi:hypothetical protein
VLPILSDVNWLKKESDTSLTYVDLEIPAKIYCPLIYPTKQTTLILLQNVRITERHEDFLTPYIFVSVLTRPLFIMNEEQVRIHNSGIHILETSCNAA